jgi:autotransporter-associated beta strand protein
VAAGLTATINSSISGSSGLNLTGNNNGGGRLVLAGNNTYTGLTQVSSGSVLNIQSANALGSASGGTCCVVQYGTLEIQGGITTAAEPLTLNGPGLTWNGALRNVSGNNNYTGPITLGSYTRIWIDSGTLTLSGGVTASGSTLEVVPVINAALVINSAVNLGAGGLTMDGSGLLTLTANNTYTGLTTINAGTLDLIGTSSAVAWNPVLFGAGAEVDGGQLIFDYSGGAADPETMIAALLGSKIYTTVAGDRVSLFDNTVTDQVVLSLVAVPEPTTLALLCISAMSLLAYTWRRRRRRAT